MSTLKAFAKRVKENGGTAFYVGGCVRDSMLGRETKDVDVEVHGLSTDTLRSVLKEFSKLNLVGESFQVFKTTFDGVPVDVSLPRVDSKVGSGHKGFEVTVNPDLGTFAASSRRDFTVNSMMMDCLTLELVDHFGGSNDLFNGVLRVVNPVTFVEDPLRVLRAARFASQLGFTVAPETVKLCNDIDLSDLSNDRVREELVKLLLGQYAQKGFMALFELGVAKKLLPEVNALFGVKQREEFHPEGCVGVHTGMVLNVLSGMKPLFSEEDFLTLMVAGLCHDFGKPLVTDETGRAHGHESAGVAPTVEFLTRLGLVSMVETVSALVDVHLKPRQLFANFSKGQSQESAVRRLANRCNFRLLTALSMGDSLGRGNTASKYNTVAEEWFFKECVRLGTPAEKKLANLLTGKDLLGLGLSPSPEFGKAMAHVYELQLDGLVKSKEDALREAKKFFGLE